MNYKPLSIKTYGSIPHLPGSRRGPGDHGIKEQQAKILTKNTRDEHDYVIVQEKLDGSCVCVANVSGKIVSLSRAGYCVSPSKYLQHRLFAKWVRERYHWFMFLKPGERIVGEWLLQAHGTRYQIKNPDSLFVVFDMFNNNNQRLAYEDFLERLPQYISIAPNVFHGNSSFSIKNAMDCLGENGKYGSLDGPEGAVWRVERKGKVDFLAKYVRPKKKDGIYLPVVTGKDPIWNYEYPGTKGSVFLGNDPLEWA